MYKLFNKYPVSKLLKKIQWNARAMFIAYAVFIGAGVTGAIFVGSDMPDEWRVLMLAAMMIGALLTAIAPFLLYDYFSHKHKSCSLFMQGSASLEIWDSRIAQSESIGGRMGVSDEYIFSACSTFYIPFFFSKDTIKAIYSRRRYHKGRLVSDPNIYLIGRDDGLYILPMGGRLVREKGGLVVREGAQTLDEWILSKMHAHMPHVPCGVVYARFLTKDPGAVTPLNFDA